MVCGIFAAAMHLRPGRRKQGEQQTHVLAKFCRARHATSRYYFAAPMLCVQNEVAEVVSTSQSVVAPKFFLAEKSYAMLQVSGSSRDRASNNLRSHNSHKNKSVLARGAVAARAGLTPGRDVGQDDCERITSCMQLLSC